MTAIEKKNEEQNYPAVSRLKRIIVLCIPPGLTLLYRAIFPKKIDVQPVAHDDIPATPELPMLPELPEDFSSLPRSQHGLWKLINDYEFETVLDIGSGSGVHASVLSSYDKKVTALDFGTSVYALDKKTELNNMTVIEADFYKTNFDKKFDCIWASHVLEHQPDAGFFLRRCMDLTKDGGIIAITVPPLKHDIVGGHLSLWNAGLLLYQLVFNGLDCHDASICSYDYNITVIVKNVRRPDVDITWDKGDIELLKKFFPDFVDEPFDGRIERWNW